MLDVLEEKLVIKPNISRFAAINMKKNKDILKNTYYIEKEGLAFIFKTIINDNHSMTVTKSVCKHFNIYEKDMLNIALHNTQKNGYAFKSMNELYREFNQSSEDMDIPMYVLSTSSNNYGTGLLVSDKILEDIKDKLYGSYYTIPSSINEVIVISESSMEENFMSYTKMIMSAINTEEVDNEEVLFDDLYFYNADNKSLEIAGKDYEKNDDRLKY